MARSKLHLSVLSVIKSTLGVIQIEEEVLVSTMCPTWKYGNHRFDIVIPALTLIIECDGEQHYRIDGFMTKTSHDLYVRSMTDDVKQQAALLMGYHHIRITKKNIKTLPSLLLYYLDKNETKISVVAPKKGVVKQICSKKIPPKKLQLGRKLVGRPFRKAPKK